MSSEPAIEAVGLRKRYGAVEALRVVDLRVEAGRVYGPLGPNGAGKTAIVRILTTLLRPDEGEARVSGRDVLREGGRVRQRIGIRSRIGLWDAIEALVAGGTTVLLTTQYLDEADRLAERIAVIDQGLVIAEGTSAELKAQFGGTGSSSASTTLHTPTPRSSRCPRWATAGRRSRMGRCASSSGRSGARSPRRWVAWTTRASASRTSRSRARPSTTSSSR
jgi:ABC-type multidrug transport system ATPase subunit